MRVCPKCGHSDNLLWENCRFKRDLQLMRIEDFEREYPLLADAIHNKEYVVEGQFVYHKTGMYVLRKEPADMRQPFYERFEALSKRKTPLSTFGHRRKEELKTQTKLFTKKGRVNQ